MAAPGFLSWTNLGNILVNNFAILALVSLGLTLVVSAGGIDLSTGTAVDLASLFLSRQWRPGTAWSWRSWPV